MKNAFKAAAAAILTVIFMTGIFLPVYSEASVYKRGDSGKAVLEAQKSLKQLGFFTAECTSYFGEATEKAVKAFQSKYALAADGKLGPVTISRLEKLVESDKVPSRADSDRSIVKSDAGYIVKKGDTVWSISKNYNVTVDALVSANKLESSSILQIGQKLIVPKAVADSTPDAAPADMEPAAPPADIPSADNSNSDIGNTDIRIYTVKSGDTFWTIAENLKITVQVIYELNNLNEQSILQVGQELKVPVAVTAPGTDTAAVPDTTDTTAGSGTTGNTAANSTPQVDTEVPQTGEYLDWFGVVDGIFKNGDIATVTDFDTRKAFKVRRLYGSSHADVEPLTAEDTAIMKSIYGEWSWDRRAIIVSVNGHHIAASMNGMPHGGEEIKDNDFDGQFCIHFKGSKTHTGDKVDPDHQAAVRKAAGLDK